MRREFMPEGSNRVILVFAVFLASVFSSIAGEAGEGSKTGTDIAIREDTRRLIRSLGAKQWKAREEAENLLSDLGTNHCDLVLDECMAVFFRAEDPEVRARLEHVVEKIVVEQVFESRNGFLGVNLGFLRGPYGETALLPVMIEGILPNTAAATNGLMAGDLILRVDDNDCDKDFGTQELIKYISGQKSGHKLKLIFSRGGREISAEIPLGSRPDIYRNTPLAVEKRKFYRQWLGEQEEKRKNEAAAE